VKHADSPNPSGANFARGRPVRSGLQILLLPEAPIRKVQALGTSADRKIDEAARPATSAAKGPPSCGASQSLLRYLTYLTHHSL
jgi:hypothetical protein